MWTLLMASALALQPDLDRADLFARADVVAIGEVTDLDCAPDAGPRGGWATRASLALQTARGPGASALGDSLEILLRGGRCFGLEQIVEGEAHLAPDRRYALALIATPEGWGVLGGAVGVVELRSPQAPFAPETAP